MINKLILDPNLFEYHEGATRQEQIDQILNLENSLSFIIKYMNLSIDAYNGAAYCWRMEDSDGFEMPPITNSKYVRDRWNVIQKLINKLLIKGDYLHDVLDDSIYIHVDISFPDQSELMRPFLIYLTYLSSFEDTSNFLMQLSNVNYICEPIVHISPNENAPQIVHDIVLPALLRPEVNCNNIVSRFFSNEIEGSPPFPYNVTCEQLNDAFLSENLDGLSYRERIPLYIKYGREMAFRNGYRSDRYLSRKNPQYDVYTNSNSTYYLSIDIEHGGLELFSHFPVHLGEVDFSCSDPKNADPQTHKLYL